MNINLIPEESVSQKLNAAIHFLAIALLAASTVAFSLLWLNSSTSMTNSIQLLDNTKMHVAEEMSKAKQIQSQINAIQNTHREPMLAVQTVDFQQFIRDIQKQANGHVILNTINYNPQIVNLAGSAQTYDDVAAFLISMQLVPTVKEVWVGNLAHAGTSLVDFNIQLTLKGASR